jgi:hypothetical protein
MFKSEGQAQCGNPKGLNISIISGIHDVPTFARLADTMKEVVSRGNFPTLAES